MKNIKIIFEDESLLVIDKPAGILVHDGKNEITIASWLENNYPEIHKYKWPEENRKGIVHRLDKETSGLLLLAKNPEILFLLQHLFKKRQIKKTYLALVSGKLTKKQGKIETFLSRDLKKDRERSRLISIEEKEKIAQTCYRVLEESQIKIGKKILPISFLELKPETGRTHQIRVQLKNLGQPILGDKIYSSKESRRDTKSLNINRHLLAAVGLEFNHPLTKKKLCFRIEVSSDFKEVLGKIGLGY